MEHNIENESTNPEDLESLRYYQHADEIVAHNAEIGSNFFSPDTMRFFKCRVLSRVYAGRFFITSEKDGSPRGGWNGERRYTIRECRNGVIFNVSEFGEFPTITQAKSAAQRLCLSLR